jgi:RNA polymerase II-associated protein 2
LGRADVVTERAIADGCGYPACPNPLPPSKVAAAPRFRISLREHRVYDLEEARKFCSERCLVASAAFAASLPPDRPFGVPPARLDALVQSGGRPELGFPAAAGGEKGGQGIKVEIKEKEVAAAGEVTLQDWIGPSDAIEGYVPRRHRAAEVGECYACGLLSLLPFF